MALTSTRPIVSRNESLILFILRTVLGIILIVKGILFIQDTTQLMTLIQQTGLGFFSRNAESFAFIVAFLNILGGTFISIGLFTRLSALVEIPIIIIAAFFVNLKNIDLGVGELVLSIVVLLLLLIFVVKGSGWISADTYFKSVFKHGNRDNEARNELEK